MSFDFCDPKSTKEALREHCGSHPYSILNATTMGDGKDFFKHRGKAKKSRERQRISN